MLLNTSMFSTGRWELHLGGTDTAKLQTYINTFEPRYMVKLFGAKMYAEFVADLSTATNQPNSPNFKKLYDPIFEDINLGQTILSEGLISMLKGFIYYEYAKDLMTQQTPYGAVVQATENGTIANTIQSKLYTIYNEAIRTFKEIRNYIYHFKNPDSLQIVYTSIVNLGAGYVTNQTTQGVALNNYLTPIGAISSLLITGTGLGYSNATNVPTIGGTGTGLTLNIVTAGGIITSVVINNAGQGYTVGNTIFIQQGNNLASISVLTIVTIPPNVAPLGSGALANTLAYKIGGIKFYNVSNIGTGYIAGTYNLINGLGTGAKITITNVSATGQINTSEITFLNTGQNYQVGEVLSIQGNAGSSGGFVSVNGIWNGEINTVTILDGGKNYKIGDHVEVAGGTTPAVLIITYVGKGDRQNYNGIELLYNTWL